MDGKPCAKQLGGAGFHGGPSAGRTRRRGEANRRADSTTRKGTPRSHRRLACSTGGGFLQQTGERVVQLYTPLGQIGPGRRLLRLRLGCLHVSRPALSSLLNGNGKAGLSGDMALRIEKAFGVKMDTLMRMQAYYDIARTRKRENTIRLRRFEPFVAQRQIRPRANLRSACSIVDYRDRRRASAIPRKLWQMKRSPKSAKSASNRTLTPLLTRKRRRP